MTEAEIQAGLSADPEEEIVQVELGEAHRKRRHGRGRIIGIGVSIVVIAGVFIFVLPRIADYTEVWNVVKTLSWEWLVVLLLAIVLNLLDLRAAASGCAAGALLPSCLARHSRL